MKKKREMKRSILENFGLGQKMSLIIGGLTFVMLLCLLYFLLHSFRLSMNKKVDANMADKVEQASYTLDDLITKLNATADNIEASISFVFDQHDEVGGVPGNPWTINDEDGNPQSITPMENVAFRSRVVNAFLPASRYNAEVVILNALYANLKTEPNLADIGILFEPNAFYQGIENYAPILSQEDLDKRAITNHPYSNYQDEIYYKAVKEKGSTFITPVYGDITKPEERMFAIYHPIMKDNQFLGTILLDVKEEVLLAASQSNEEFPSMFVNLIDGEGIIHSKNEVVNGKTLQELLPEKASTAIAEKMESKEAFALNLINEHGKERREYYYPIDMEGSTWWTRLSISHQDYSKEVDRLRNVGIVAGFSTVFALAFACALLIGYFLKPLQKVVEVGEKLSVGDFDMNLSYKSKDEIGRLMHSMGDVVSRIRSIIGDLSEKLNQLAQGNFNVEMNNAEYYSGAYRPLFDSIQNISTDLSGTMAEIQQSAVQVNSGAEQVSSGAQGLSQGATEQASSIEELSATMNDISAKIKETAETTREASRLSNMAGQSVMVSNEKMREMSLAMEEITEKSQEISKIIKTIDDIAFQTNILSLNAAIEAARAGAAGKGFAVVADEVGNLAQKSAKAAQNTSSLIEETIEAVNKGVRISEETAESLTEVVTRAGKINDLIDIASSSSEEQARGVSQLSVGIDQISSVVQSNTATAEESAAASEELSGQANILSDLVGRFRLREE